MSGGARRGARRGRAPRRSAHRTPAEAALAVGGRRAAYEAVRAGVATRVLLAKGARTTPGLRDLLDACARAEIPTASVEREELDALATDHRGVVAVVRLPSPVGEQELSRRTFADDALVVVLDGIEDPQNLGAAARAAEAAGVTMLVTRRARSADVTPAAVRASAGALLHLPHARVANLARALDRLREVGFTVVGLDETARTSVHEAEREGRTAIVIGAEGEGLSRIVRERCDALLALPMRGRVGSLNASSALAAVLYAYALRPARTAERERPAGGDRRPRAAPRITS